MATEREGYLPPQQQLILAAKVNRLCEVLPEDFNPQTQVDDVREIIKALDPRLQIQRGMQFTLFIPVNLNLQLWLEQQTQAKLMQK